MKNPNDNDNEPQWEIVPLNSIEAVERAQIDLQIATARRYPRALAAVKADMIAAATMDEETAQSCFYSLPRSGKNIEGPSIRMAEIALACYGNVRTASRVVEVVAAGEHPYVAIQAVAHDLEKNVAISMEKRRRITAKKERDGSRRPIDDDDITLATNAASAVALRDAIFKVVPGALVRAAFEAARRYAVGDQRTLAERRARALEAFAKAGVPSERVLAGIGRANLNDVSLADLEQLIGIFNAIKDGHTSIDNAFPVKEPPLPPSPPAPPKKKAERVATKPDLTPPLDIPPTAGAEESKSITAPDLKVPMQPHERLVVVKEPAEGKTDQPAEENLDFGATEANSGGLPPAALELEPDELDEKAGENDVYFRLADLVSSREGREDTFMQGLAAARLLPNNPLAKKYAALVDPFSKNFANLPESTVRELLKEDWDDLEAMVWHARVASQKAPAK
jgi:hypothetical protein